MGVNVLRNEAGWEIAVLPMELTGKGKELFKKDVVVSHRHFHHMRCEAL
jgi:hypothetical protein